MAHKTEEVSRKFAFRNPADAMYENVVRGRVEKRKGHPRGVTTYDAERGSCLFYRVEAKTYDIVPGRVAGFYFRDPVLFPSSPLPMSSFFFPFARTPLRRPFSANGINFRPRSTAQ